MTIIVCAAIGAVVSMFVGWLLLPPVPPPEQLRVRVATNPDIVVIGIKLGDDVTFLKFNR